MTTIKELNISKKKELGIKPLILENTTIKDVSFGEYVEIGKNNHMSESSIDDFSYTSENCQIIYSTIAKFVNIASYVRLNPGQHPIQRVTQHHMLYRKEMFGFGSDDESFFDWRREKKVVVGNDVWIGHNVTVMGGVSIGDGAVIGSGAIVTKDIPPFAIAVGNPAKVIRYRFDEKIREKLLQIKWWNWDYETIKKRLNEFNEIDQFIQKYGYKNG
jgi:phosphonate metabolism protein (transferase hexapeptide repeat family)